VKEELDISWNGWKQVPGETRTKCWDRIVTRFIFPAPQVELAKKYFFQQMAISFRNWRYEMNVEWLQRGRDPTSHYKISAAQWERFRELKTTEEALAKSKAASELAKRNKYAHHLGTGGYKAKEPEWEREEAELRKKGANVLTDMVSARGARWLKGRQAKVTPEGVKVPSVVSEVAKKMMEVRALELEGKFKADRENDDLTHSLGNPEHPGRVRGVSSKISWKHGFGPQWEGIYKSRQRYKEAMRNYFQEQAKKDFAKMMSDMLSNPPPQVLQQ